MAVGTGDRTSHCREGLYAAADVAGPLVEHQPGLHSRFLAASNSESETERVFLCGVEDVKTQMQAAS